MTASLPAKDAERNLSAHGERTSSRTSPGLARP
jgi:hypothetical protein